MKKSFLLHIDSLGVLDDLSDSQCGELFKAIKSYHNDEKISLSPLVKIAFSPFKNQFIRDGEKYQKTCERRAIAGSKGGKQRVANQAIARKTKQRVANQADKKNKKDNDNDNESDNKTITLPVLLCSAVWDEWVLHRKELKKKLTASQIAKQIKFLSNQPNPELVIEQSIMNGWTGLFELKKQNQGNQDDRSYMKAEFK